MGLIKALVDSQEENKKENNNNLEDWQNKLVKEGKYNSFNFEEEELEADDFVPESYLHAVGAARERPGEGGRHSAPPHRYARTLGAAEAPDDRHGHSLGGREVEREELARPLVVQRHARRQLEVIPAGDAGKARPTTAICNHISKFYHIFAMSNAHRVQDTAVRPQGGRYWSRAHRVRLL